MFNENGRNLPNIEQSLSLIVEKVNRIKEYSFENQVFIFSAYILIIKKSYIFHLIFLIYLTVFKFHSIQVFNL